MSRIDTSKDTIQELLGSTQEQLGRVSRIESMLRIIRDDLHMAIHVLECPDEKSDCFKSALANVEKLVGQHPAAGKQ